MGLETADDYLRNIILKRSMSKETIADAAKIIKEEKIKLETMNILAIPGGSLEADFETLKFNIECRTDYSSVKLLMPYPGTQIHGTVEKKKLLMEKYPSSPWISPLRFVTKKEKHATENLHKLFSITAAFPFLFPLLKTLIYLPFDRFYILINLFWEGYASFFRLYPTGYRGFWRGISKYRRIFRRSL